MEKSTDKKPWEALGVSRSKYYRDQRTGTKKPKTKTPPAKKRGRPRKVAAAPNGQQWMIDKETPVTADGAAAVADGAPRHLWQAVDAVSLSHERIADEALIQDFMSLTDADVVGETRLFHFSARMVEALRRVVASS